MAVEAAIRAEGVALARSTLVADDIAAGRLVAPFRDLRLKAERGYDLAYRVGERNHPKVEALRLWLHKEIRALRNALRQTEIGRTRRPSQWAQCQRFGRIVNGSLWPKCAVRYTT